MAGQPRKNPDAAAPDTMRYWLARTLKTARTEKGVSLDAVRQLIPGRDDNPMDPTTLSRFENGQTWPRELDNVVTAYAVLCGIEDARILWAQAANDFLTNGVAPTLGEVSSTLRSVLLAIEAHQHRRPYGDESQGTPTAKPRRRAAER